ncbi:hypothetical protein GLW04_13705 [Halobacillus litoralis]|uniref:Uncharacterized protein n=1 Tax=Halobacillus litoralis TaxID=45668 RepID=A0A845E5N6_9BACI|nr:hypothetical protein [Halobacillus litoralis]MYL20954.1 hypothetical protein [Halobacillus litoralis]MYL36205.1 hypothetical protein [Halobacillus litoralis]
MTCRNCDEMDQRLKQQEDTIVQLVHIIGSTNKRVKELNERQLQLQPAFINEPAPASASTT